MDTIKRKAPAKINLTLDVIGKRPNGYHDLRMLMQTIDLSDEITVTKIPEDKIVLSMNKELPDGCPTQKNLVYRAAELIRTTYQLIEGVSIYLEKNIPAAAGLAGGSTDCAATLLAMNELFSLDLSTERLCELGVTLGADVPFCICKGTMLSEGIGEVLTRMPDLPPMWAVLVKPPISVSTAFVYGNLDLEHLPYHPDTEKIIADIKRKDTAQVARDLSNVLETVTIPAYPVIDQIKKYLMEQKAVGALMSGSGPTTYGLFQDEIQARMAFRAAKEEYADMEVILCQTKLPQE